MSISSKSTWCASNSGPSTQTNLVFLPQSPGMLHTCLYQVHHDGIEGCDGRDVVFFGESRNECHNNGRPDGNAQIDFFALDNLFNTIGNQSFFAV